MSVINKLLQIILALSVLGLVYALTLTGTFSSSQKLTEVLDKSGFYESLAKGLSNQLKSQVIGTPEITSQVNTGISSGITPELVKNIMQPSQIAAVEWLNKSSGSLDIKIDMETVKDRIVSKTPDSQAKFEATKLLPDLVVVVDSSKKDSGAVAGLERFKQAYEIIKSAIPILWAAVGLAALLLFILNMAGGSKKLTRIGYALVLSSIIGLALALLFRFVAGGINLNVVDSKSVLDVTLITKIIITVISQTLMIFAVIGIVGLACILTGKIVFRGRDKKLKKK